MRVGTNRQKVAPTPMGISIEAFAILLMILVNGLFAMAELALVSARRARLAAKERRGVLGAAQARKLA